MKKERIGLDALHPALDPVIALDALDPVIALLDALIALDALDVRMAVLRTLPDGVARDFCFPPCGTRVALAVLV